MSQPWEDSKYVWGLTDCGDLIILDKPLNELTDEDREKIDSIIIDGDGNLFHSDDGTYKAVPSIGSIILTYDANPVNFILLNNESIIRINELYRGSQATFVYLNIGGYYIPLEVSYNASQLIFNYEQTVISSPITRVAEPTYNKLKVLIALNTISTPYTIDAYEFKNVKTFDLVTDGNGGKALYDNGEYVETYTKEQTDDAIANAVGGGLDNVYTKQETDDKIAEAVEDAVMYDANNDVQLRNNIVLNNDANLFGKTLQGGQVNLIQCSRFTDLNHPIVDIGSTTAHITFNSYDRPNVQLFGESGNNEHEMAFLADIEEVDERLTQSIITESETRANADQALQDQITQNKSEFDEFQTTVNQTFITVNGAIGDVNDRVDVLDGRVTVNESDIASLRDAVTNAEHFRGYYQTNAEITALPDPTNGDFAWSAESGTIWIYNGTTWLDSGDPIPDQTVSPSDSLPLIDGTASAGTSNEYSRGDHRHPTDTTRAAAADLDNYLLLAGNSQTTPMTGSIWLGTQNKVYLSDSGNSFLGYDTGDTGSLVLRGNGSNGIDLQSDLGTIKANGQRVIVNGNNVNPTVIQSGFSRLSMAAGTTAIEGSNIGIESTGSLGLHSTDNITIVSEIGKAYYGSSVLEGNEIARISNINQLQDQIDALSPEFGNYVKNTGDSMSGDLEFTSGADIVLGYSSEQTSSIYAIDDNGTAYNVFQLRTNVPTTPTPIDQLDLGNIGTQFNANSMFVPTVDIPVTGYPIDEQYNYSLPSTKYRFVLDRWLRDNYSNNAEIAGQYYTQEQVNTLLGLKVDTSYLTSNYYDKTEVDAKFSDIDLTQFYTKEQSDIRYILNGSNPGNVYVNTASGRFFYNGNTDSFEVATKGDIATAIAGIDLSLYYTSAEVDALLADKADVTDLSLYIPKAGGEFTGNVTFNNGYQAQFGSQSNRIRYDASTGNQYLEIYGGNTGGINMRTTTGTVKINGVQIATIDDIQVYTAGEGIDITNNVISATAPVVTIADSDLVLTFDQSGLKANIDANLNGTVLSLTGKDNVVIKAIDFAPIISGVVDGSVTDGILTLVLANGTEIPIDVSDLLSVYTATGYIDLDSNNNFTLDYDLLKDSLLGDGFINNLSNYYTSAQVDTLLSAKANTADVYSKTESDNLLSDKANSDDVYTKTESDAELESKANIADVYTQSQVNNLLNEYYTKVDADANFVTLGTSQTISGTKTFVGTTGFTNGLYTGASVTDGTTGVNLQSNGNAILTGELPQLVFRASNATSGTAYIRNTGSQLIISASAGVGVSNDLYSNNRLITGENGVQLGSAGVDISGVNPFVSFKFNNATNTTSQIVETASGVLNVPGTLQMQGSTVAKIEQTPQYGEIRTITSISGGAISGNNVYDVRYTYTGGTGTVNFSGFIINKDGREHMLSIINNGSGTLTVNFANLDTGSYQWDDDTVEIPSGRIAEISMRRIGIKNCLRVVGV